MNFREMLKGAQPLVGVIHGIGGPEVAEILAGAGFDWLFVDGEHSALEITGIQRVLQVVGNKVPCVVRCPGADEIWVKKILDQGPQAIMFPQVNSAQAAERLVSMSKYPPAGIRSVGLTRAHGYGATFREYLEAANRETAVVVQAEHIDAVNAIEEIASVEGVDAIFIGPYDLSASMGKPGRVKDADVQDNIERVLQVCLRRGVAAGIFTTNPAEVGGFIRRGFRLICAGVDSIYLVEALKAALDVCRG